MARLILAAKEKTSVEQVRRLRVRRNGAPPTLPYIPVMARQAWRKAIRAQRRADGCASHTALLAGRNNAAGIAVVEVYDRGGTP